MNNIVDDEHDSKGTGPKNIVFQVSKESLEEIWSDSDPDSEDEGSSAITTDDALDWQRSLLLSQEPEGQALKQYLMQQRGLEKRIIENRGLGISYRDGYWWLFVPLNDDGEFVTHWKRVGFDPKTCDLFTDEAGNPIMEIGGEAVLYLFDLARQREHQPLVIFERELDAILARQFAINGVAVTGGVFVFEEEWARQIKQHPRAQDGIYLLFDRRESGQDRVQHAADVLLKAGLPVLVGQLPVDRGAGTILLEDGRETLQAIIDSAEKYVPWDNPKPLPKLPIPHPFDAAMLPSKLKAWVVDVAERMQVPMDFPGVGMMVTAAAAISRRMAIRPKRKDDWMVVPNLWGLIVGRPGHMKSPALSEVTKPLRDLEANEAKKYAKAIREYQSKQRWMKARERELKNRLKKAKSETEAQDILAEYTVDEPVCQRFIVNDTTPEKLGEILRDNPKGVLVLKDELSGWLASFHKRGYEGARQFYLEAWDGTGGFISDRISRGTIRIPHICISLLGSIQPSVLISLLDDSITGGAHDDGMLQRFQLLVWPELDTDFENIDRHPDEEAKQLAYDTIQYLTELDASELNAEFDEGRGVHFLRFNQEAQVLFNDWRETFENRIRTGEEKAAFIAHLAKYRSLLPSLTLIYHLASGNTGPVGEEALQAGLRWLGYLESHAVRVYGIVKPEKKALESLAQHFKDRKLEDGFTVRDVYRKKWSGLSEKEVVEKVLEVLLQLHWLRAQEVKPNKKGGRPTTKYYINPKIHQSGEASQD